MDLDVEALKAKLAALKTEHRDLDDVIARLAERSRSTSSSYSG